MGNKITAKQTGLLLFAMLCMLCATPLCVAGEETFITEEQATIGGESDTEKTEEASQPSQQVSPPPKQVPQSPEQVPQSSEQIPKPSKIPKPSGIPSSSGAQGQKDIVLKQTVSDNSVSDNSVSVNSVRDGSETSHKKSKNIQFRKKFSVPSQKKSQDQFHRQSDIMKEQSHGQSNITQEQTMQQETTVVSEENDLPVRICFVTGILCLLAGIARIVWRIVIPCRKLYRHML